MKKTIYTHVSPKALKGIRRIAEMCGGTVYLYPVPYGKDFDRFTVVVTREQKIR